MAERFPVTEFHARRDALQARMAAAGQDALWLTSAADIFYLTGFLTRFWESPARPWHVILPARGDPVAVIPSIGAALMGETWITEIRSWNAPDPADDGVSLLTDTLSALVPDRGTIAVPKGLETKVMMPMADYEAVTAALAPRTITDGTDTLQRVREVKSEAEIARIRATCAVAGRAFARVPDFAAPGTPVAAVFRDFQRALLEEGADWVSYTAGGAGQGGYGDVISPPAATPLALGDVLMLDTGAVRDGYFCDFDRNFSIGPPAPATARAQEALWQATGTALSDLRPGMAARDLWRLLHDALLAQGATPLGGRLGHGLGLTLTEWPSLTSLDRTPLRAGMVLTLEPGVEIEPGRILVHEENIVLRPEGAELLSPRAPRDMTVIA